MEEYIKDIVKNLYENFGYRICEFSGYLSVYPWGAVKVKEGLCITFVFSALDEGTINIMDLEKKVILETGCSNVNINLINVVDTNGRLLLEKLRLLNQRGIVIDKESSEVLAFGSIDEESLKDLYQAVIHSEYKKKNKTWSLVTNVLIGINIGVYILTAILSGNIINSNLGVLVFLGAKVNSLILNGEFYRLITCMFLHGGIMHLAFNMYALYSLGPLVENIYGRKKFIAIYFIAGFLSSIMSLLFSVEVSIGASGAIFGLLGAALVFGYKNKNSIGKEFMTNIFFVIAINLFMGFSIPNVDNFGHLGGLIGGILSSMIISRKQ